MSAAPEVNEATGPTSTQIGAIAECLVTAGILEASGGRLSPFKPIADDDGLDLLLFDKLTRRPIPLQIKCRRNFDDPKAQTVQFDVRLKTFAAHEDGYILCIKLDGTAIGALWLVPAKDLRSIAKATPTHLVVTPSAKPTSQDRLSPYRLATFAEVADRILDPAKA
ncbi:MAG: hypothetical protein H6924_04820 [Alphaproteobacteria bacterium]|nr:hypothetical protein [Alphaproteobacteria bacterium]